MSDNPTANVHVESFDGTFRQGCLNAHRFITLSPAKEIIEAWWREYNESRSQKVLGERTSNEFACQFATSRNLTSLQDLANSLGSWYEKPGPLSS